MQKRENRINKNKEKKGHKSEGGWGRRRESYSLCNISCQVLNTVKWLKLVHKIKKKSFTVDSPLPPDIKIKTKVIHAALFSARFSLTDSSLFMVLLVVPSHCPSLLRLSIYLSILLRFSLSIQPSVDLCLCAQVPIPPDQ